MVPAGARRDVPAIRLGGREAEALIWHHGYKGLDAALKAAEAPTGQLRQDVRAELVAKLAADRCIGFKHPDVAERAAMLEVWSGAGVRSA